MAEVKLFNMCMVYNKENDTVLVQDKIHSDWGGLTFPGGHVENGESLVESTIREVKEETGLDVSKLEFSGLIHWYNKDTHERWFIYLYRTTEFSGDLINGTREGKVFWCDFTEFVSGSLAPDMDEYLKVYRNDDISEAYATWSDSETSKFRFL